MLVELPCFPFVCLNFNAVEGASDCVDEERNLPRRLATLTVTVALKAAVSDYNRVIIVHRQSHLIAQ